MRRAKPGTIGPITAEAFNEFAAAADAGRGGGLPGMAGGLAFGVNPSVVRIKNATASAVPRWGVLSVSAPLILPSTNEASFQQQVLLNGAAPAKGKRGFIALEAVPANAIGSFMAPGVVVAVKVNKEENITYKTARPSTNTGRLDAVEESDVEGDDRTVEILWHETGTGEKWALVLMPGRQSPSLTVLGPCATYTPAVELPDTDFDVEFPGGCLGPSRFGLNYRNLITGTASFVPLELEDAEASPLVFSSDVFAHGCAAGSVNVYASLEVPSTERDTVTLRVRKASDDSLMGNFRNPICSFFPMQAGYLQFGPDAGSCECPTFPYEACLSVPTR